MKLSTITLLSSMLIGAVPAIPAMAADATTQPAEADAASQTRAASIFKGLKIDDTAKAADAEKDLATYLSDIHQWHTTNDAKLKELSKATTQSSEAAALQAERHAIHDRFIAAITPDLTADQLEALKEKLTGGQMMATVKNYPQIVKNITPEESAMILKTLQAGREEAMDAGSKNERVAIFKKYKGQINNELDAHGHHVAQDYKDWGAAQKAKNGTATKPAEEGGAD
jgi:hypothetical protein